MKQKAKGSNAERELVHMFWDKGWAAIRVAGSGSSQYPSPDVLAGNNLRKLAVECKASGELNKYISLEQIDNLAKFARLFGAEPWVGIRFDRMDWLFLCLEDLERTESNYRITPVIAKRKGLLFEELIR